MRNQIKLVCPYSISMIDRDLFDLCKIEKSVEQNILNKEDFYAFVVPLLSVSSKTELNLILKKIFTTSKGEKNLPKLCDAFEILESINYKYISYLALLIRKWHVTDDEKIMRNLSSSNDATISLITSV